MPSISSIARFIKLEHSIYSLPFIFLGLMLGRRELGHETLLPLRDTLLVLTAAVGARGLAMTLNRLIDRPLDAANPRTAGRHLATGELSVGVARAIATVFLVLLVVAAGLLNPVVLILTPVPVLVLWVYPWLKRLTWACHLWLGTALGLAPVAAWLAIVADPRPDGLAWGAISSGTWSPHILLCFLGVLTWVAGFDVIYALLDLRHDRRSGIHSLPADTSARTATRTALGLHMVSITCFALMGLTQPLDHWAWWVGTAIVAAMMGTEAWLVKGADEAGARDDPTVTGIEMATVQKVFFQLNGGVGLILALAGALALLLS